jgi:hypothetical protein
MHAAERDMVVVGDLPKYKKVRRRPTVGLVQRCDYDTLSLNSITLRML